MTEAKKEVNYGALIVGRFIRGSKVTNALLLIVFLITRVIFSSLQLSSTVIPNWAEVFVQFVLFTIIGILILINRKNLTDFNIDYSSILIFFLFGVFFRVRKIDSVATLAWEFLFFLLAVVILIFYWQLKPELIKRNPFNTWFSIAVVFGFLLGFVVTTFDPSLESDAVHSISRSRTIYYFLYYVYFGIGATGILEEPLYRGFLFGYLKNLGFRDSHVVIWQAILFTLSHFNYITHPFSFYFSIPVLGLLTGFLALKSKSIVPPLIAHIIYNAYLAVYVFY